MLTREMVCDLQLSGPMPDPKGSGWTKLLELCPLETKGQCGTFSWDLDSEGLYSMQHFGLHSC